MCRTQFLVFSLNVTNTKKNTKTKESVLVGDGLVLAGFVAGATIVPSARQATRSPMLRRWMS